MIGLDKLVDSIMQETTTSGDVSFVPSHVGVVTALKKKLSKKKHWKLSISENPVLQEYNVGFDSDSILVKKKDWDAFQGVLKGFGKVDRFGEDRYFTVLSNLLSEAVATHVEERQEELELSLLSTVKSSPCSDVARQLSFFSRVFKWVSFVGSTVAILYGDEDKGVARLSEDLDVEYKDDLGAYDMLISSLTQKQSLKFSLGINRYKYLYGADAIVSYRGAAIKYESYVDLNFVPHEQIQILGVEDALNELDGFDNAKLYANVLFPRGKHFSYRFLERIKVELDTEL